MVPLRKKMIDIFLEQVGYVSSTGSTNLTKGSIKDLMKKLTGGSIAIDAEEANNKIRKLTNTSIQNILADSARKIGCFMHTTYIMNWVKVVSDTLGINASKELTFISEKEFAIKIETLIMHRAIPIIEYYVRWAEYRQDQRAYILDYLHELGIFFDQNDSPVQQARKEEKSEATETKKTSSSKKEENNGSSTQTGKSLTDKTTTEKKPSSSTSTTGEDSSSSKKDLPKTASSSSLKTSSSTSSSSSNPRNSTSMKKKDVAVDDEF